MNLQQFQHEADVTYRAVETATGVEYVVDLGPDATDAAVDVVDGTALVVIGDDQYDLDLPTDSQAFMRNGVLTITMEDSA